MRVWAERGDFSKVTEQSIRNPALHADQEDSKAGEDEDKDTRPTIEDVRKLQETMIYSLAWVFCFLYSPQTTALFSHLRFAVSHAAN
jgi:hypothetical protein